MDLARALLRIKHPPHALQESTIMLTAATMSLNPLFLRHDLMIELGRLEMAMQDMRSTDTVEQTPVQLQQLENRRARINEALSRLPA